MRTWAFITISLLLTACGGSGSSSTVSTAPVGTIEVVDDSSGGVAPVNTTEVVDESSGGAAPVSTTEVVDGSSGGAAPVSTTEVVDESKEFTILVDPKTDSPPRTPLTFGMAFSEGDLPFAKELSAKVDSGNGFVTVPVQVDRKASYCATSGMEFESKESCVSEDRFVRHAIISMLLPEAVAAGGRSEIVLSPSSEDVVIDDTKIEFPANLSVKTYLDDGAQKYVADLSRASTPLLQTDALMAAGTSTADVTEWLSGSLVREWIVRVPFVVQSSELVEHPHLVARYHVRHYPESDNTRVDVVVENNWAFEPQVRSYDYSIQIFIGDDLRYQESELTHFVHSRWRVTLWDSNYPELHVRHDPYQLMESRVSPNYDPELVYSLDSSLDEKYSTLWDQYKPTVQEGVMRHSNKAKICLQSVDSQYSANCSDPATYHLAVNGVGPMGIGVVPARFMPQTGGRVEIAPLPEWTAAWVLQQSYPLYKMMLGIGNGSGSWPIHFRDKTTDLPLSTADWPNTRIDKGSANAIDTSSCYRSIDCQSPYVADNAHQASFAFIPYVVTGDYYYLEEVQFWATYNSAKMSPGYRGGAKGLFERASQLRGAAWGLRNLAHAAWISPDVSSLKKHFLYMLESNLKEYNAIYIDDPSRRVEYGAAVEYSKNISAPWMDDYFTWSVGHIVELGYDSYLPLARWKGRFPVGRMGFSSRSEDNYCWIFAANYRLRTSPFDDSDNVPVVNVTSGLGTVLRERAMFQNLADVFRYSNKAIVEGEGAGSGALETREICASQAQADEQGLQFNQMKGYPQSTGGYVSQLQPALAMSVDRGTENAEAAWSLFESRATLPNFSSSPGWAIVPRLLGENTTIPETPVPAN